MKRHAGQTCERFATVLGEVSQIVDAGMEGKYETGMRAISLTRGCECGGVGCHMCSIPSL